MGGNNTVLIRALTTLAGVVVFAIVALAIWGPKENSLAAGAIQTIVTVITLVAGLLITLKVSTDAKTAAIESKAVSEDNNAKITAVVDDVKIIHSAVNSAKTALEKKVADLTAALASSDKTLAVERNQHTADQTAQQVKDDAAGV